MRTLLVVGNDKLGRRLIHGLLGNFPANLTIVIDGCKSWPRIYKLLRGGRLGVGTFLKMVWAELVRRNYSIPMFNKVVSDSEIVDYAKKIDAGRVFLFRVSIIIKPETLSRGLPFYNTHCADIIKYGGLGSLSKALAKGDFSQRVVIHRVTPSIDVGEEISSENYNLNPKLTYPQNEEIAYSAGIKLLSMVLGGNN